MSSCMLAMQESNPVLLVVRSIGREVLPRLPVKLARGKDGIARTHTHTYTGHEWDLERKKYWFFFCSGAGVYVHK